jgi:restriction system protein
LIYIVFTIFPRNLGLPLAGIYVLMLPEFTLSYTLALFAPLLLIIEPGIDLMLGGNKGKRLYRRSRNRGIESLQKIGWKDFEHLCAGYFSRHGYNVELKGLGGADGGMDLVIRRHGKRYLVQCKHWKGRVGVSVVREMFGVMHAEQFSDVFVVGLSGFTKEAWNWSKGKPIRLMDGKSLVS